MKKIISKVLTTIMLITMLSIQTVSAEYEEKDGFRYIKDTNIITAYIGTDSEVVIPENTVLRYSNGWLARRITNESGSKTISDNVRKLTISKNVEYDGDVFERSSNELSNLEEVVFAEGVTEIPDDAFWGFETIKKVTLPSTLKRIGENVFASYSDYGAPQIEELVLPASLEYIDASAF